MKFEGIIFDMDGVLVNTEHAYYKHRLQFFENKGIAYQHLPKSYFTGGRMQDLWLDLLGEGAKEFDLEQLQQDYVDYRDAHAEPYDELLFPDVVDLLKFLKSRDYKIALASSSSRNKISQFFLETGLSDYFDVACSGEDFFETKPNPEIYLTAMKKLGSAAGKTLIIEDSTVGIAAGKSSGEVVWAIRDKEFDLDQSAADRLFDNLAEIQQELENE